MINTETDSDDNWITETGCTKAQGQTKLVINVNCKSDKNIK